MNRNVIEINESKCVGCGLCANACNQGAIKIIDGKAKLVSDSYCDGLGICLPKCPVDAIKLVEKDVKAFDQSRKNYKKKQAQSMGCPGTISKTLKPKSANDTAFGCQSTNEKKLDNHNSVSQLQQWPIQINLVSPQAPYFENANLLIAADCTAYAYANFHQDFIKNHITIIGCPKLDDNEYYKEKLTEILKNNSINSITVVRMEVPCCSGIVNSVKNAMLNSQKIVPYREVTITTDGKVL